MPPKGHPRRRGQAALEYVVTYGWVFVGIALVLGALAYFGVLDPSQWSADRCYFGTQLSCEDALIDTSIDELSFYLRNNFGKNITVTDARILDNGQVTGTCTSCPVMIRPSKGGSIVIQYPAGRYTQHEKERIIARVEIQRTQPASAGPSPWAGVPKHNLTGLIFIRAQ